MSLHMACEMTLPAWLDEFVSAWTEPLDTDEQRNAPGGVSVG